ncbi:MAG: sulfatase-like hydrolase/transferase [Candidatus Sumerlaeaceae bacterium]
MTASHDFGMMFKFSGAVLRTIAFIAIALVAPNCGAAEKPNILWITCEDMSPDLGCYGDTAAHTPNLDLFASQAMRFTNTFAAAPVCAPSRSSLITGMYPTTIGTHHMRSKAVPPAYVRCFTEYLRAAGYYCTNNSKTDYNFDSPVTAWDENGRSAHWKNRPAGTPFFSVFNLISTHESKFHQSKEEIEKLLLDVPAGERHSTAVVPLPPYYPDTPIVREDMARYYDLITAMDKQAGALLRELEDEQLTTSTIVFFFSDHGRGLPRGKRWVYDSGIRVPLIIRGAGVTSPGTICSDLVSFVDFAPTVLRLAGLKVPEKMQGRPILGDSHTPHRYIFAARDRMDETYDVIRCVRDQRFKYIRNFEPEKPYAQTILYGEKTPTMQELRRLHTEGKLNPVQELFFRPGKPIEELYDCLQDPHETNDLTSSAAHRQTLLQMRAELETWRTKTGDLGLIPEAQLQEQMRPGGKWSQAASPVITVNSDGQVVLQSETDGASIAYRKETKQAKQPWVLYSGPVAVDQPTTITAKACRLGWNDSAEVVQFATPGANR